MKRQIEWKPAPGLEDYAISESGWICRMTPGRGATLGRMTRGAMMPIGYWMLHQRIKGTRKKRMYYVHRLVCEAFHGSPPASDPEVDHINGDRGDNHASNLRWVTAKENHANAGRLGRNDKKLTLEQRERAVAEYRSGRIMMDIALDYGCSERNICQLLVTRGVPRRKPYMTIDERFEMADRFEAGESVGELALAYGRRATTIITALGRTNIHVANIPGLADIRVDSPLVRNTRPSPK